MATSGYNGKTLVAISAVFIILEFTFVVLRFYARRLTPSGVGWDDVLVPLAWLANLGLCIVGVRMTMIGNTSAQSSPAPAQGLDPGQQISILCLYLRIFVKRGTRIACYVLIGVITANWIAFSIADIFQCTPVAYQWDKSIAHGTCFNDTLFSRASSVPNIITDVVMLVLPIPVLWRLQTSTVRKLGLTVVFFTGSVGLVGSSIREMAFSTHIEDKSRSFFFLTAWSIIEAGMYLIAACLLALRPVIAQALPKWLRAYVSGRHSRKPAEGLDDSNHKLQLNASPPPHSHPSFTGGACLQGEKVTASNTPFHYKPTFPIVHTYEYDVERGFAHSLGPLGERSEHDPRFITSNPRDVI